MAEALEGIPSDEFYDVLAQDGDLWCAGDGLHRYRNRDGEWELVAAGDRFTALAGAPDGRGVWAAGPDGLVLFDGENGLIIDRIAVDIGYIWTLVPRADRLWIVGSHGYSWIETGSGRAEEVREMSFEPRPFVFNVAGEEDLFIGAGEGVWRVGHDGRELVIPLEATGGEGVAWMIDQAGGYLLGTPEQVYRWEGISERSPVVVESNYSAYFQKGIGNALDLGSLVAVVDFPDGVVFLDKETGQVSGYTAKASGLSNGDVYKLVPGHEGEILVLGKAGLAIVDPSRTERFFPSGPVWGGGEPVLSGSDGRGAYLFTDDRWVHVRGNTSTTGELMGSAYWFAVGPDRRGLYGYLNSYYRFTGKGWERNLLEQPLMELAWAGGTGLALGQDGLYALSEGLDLDLVYPSAERLDILGELHGELVFKDTSGTVYTIIRSGTNWLTRRLRGRLTGRVRNTVAVEEALFVSTEAGLYRLGRETGVTAFDLPEGWRVFGLATDGTHAFAGLVRPDGSGAGVAEFGPGGRFMLELPGRDLAGEVVGLVATEDRLGLVGKAGLAWYHSANLERLSKPVATFRLLYEGETVEGRRLPHGAQLLNLEAAFPETMVPADVEYRINGGLWRVINPRDPALQFAGHGGFRVELRSRFPNGTTGAGGTVSFRISPPWYLNPYYQGLIFVLLVAGIWGIYILRHAQLKRTNRWLENEVKKQTRELEAATAARTNFLAGLSHDIRNPLNGVLMIAETLSRDPPSTADDSRLKDLTEFGIVVDRMLGEILDFSAIDQTSMPMAYIPVSITDILQSSIRQNQYSIRKALVEMTLEIPSELREVVIKADRNWMIKILTNLIVNALEYSGSERIEVGVVSHRLTPRDAELEIYVKDWGMGIDDAEKPFVFDRFYRGETGVESGKHGTGLGLSICQEIAHAMGAHLSLTDNEPSGCCFFLKGRFERVSGARELDREAVLEGLNGSRVLVVDDLAYNRRSIVDFLKSLGCNCDESESGREALTLLGENRYDLALLDWDLPGLMGPDIARQHRAGHPEDPVKLIALTAYTEGDKKRQSVESGMNGYIAKPLTAGRLAYCLAGLEEEAPQALPKGDTIDSDELDEEIYKHVEDCLRHGEHYEWENLRRCAHRLTTLALIRKNTGMQQVCRDLQVSAEAENAGEIRVGLAELQQWRRT